jgi:hypothetical protein
MTIKVIPTCPWGHKCERMIDEETIERCRGYVEIEGQNPTTGEMVKGRKCSILEWTPILLLEVGRTNRGTGQAVESLRNTMAEAPMLLPGVLMDSVQRLKTLPSG